MWCPGPPNRPRHMAPPTAAPLAFEGIVEMTTDTLPTPDAAVNQPRAGLAVDRLEHPQEAADAFEVFRRSMLGLALTPEHAEVLVEPGRAWGAVLPGPAPRTVVGAVDSWSPGTVVLPGGARVSHAAVSRVGVLPTHTRRGVLSGLMRAQLEEFAATKVAVASLRASEAVIYERFGYGVASLSTRAALDVRGSDLRSDVALTGHLRLLDGQDTGPVVRALHAAVDTPGHITRSDQWWALHAEINRARRVWTAVHSTDGVDDGYVVYAGQDPEHWFTSRCRTLTVSDFVALTPAAHAGLVAHLTGLDLVHRVEWPSWRVDDPLPWLLRDRRALTVEAVRDESWLRLVDVQTVLNARRWAPRRPVAVTVSDAQLPHNCGTWLIGPDGAERIGGDGALRVDVAALATLVLGAASWWQLARTSRVQATSSEALSAADALFSTDQAPYSGTSF